MNKNKSLIQQSLQITFCACLIKKASLSLPASPFQRQWQNNGVRNQMVQADTAHTLRFCYAPPSVLMSQRDGQSSTLGLSTVLGQAMGCGNRMLRELKKRSGMTRSLNSIIF